MALSDSLESEYLALRNYKENGLTGRGFLIRIMKAALEQIEAEKWIKAISEAEKPQIRSLIQIDIISKIMMLIEDLAILAESFRQGKNFYDFLVDEKADVGEMIGDFFASVESFSDKDIMTMLSYENPESLGIDEPSTSVLDDVIKSNVSETRRILKQIGVFGKTNHPVFKKYKHAGMPIVGGATQSAPTGLLGIFLSFSMVSVGADPKRDILPIPYSKDVMKGYDLVIGGIQGILMDMTTNRMACIERGISKLVPTEYYGELQLTKNQEDILKQITEQFYDKHPASHAPKQLNYESNVKMKDLQWYLELQSFLDECKARGERQAQRKQGDKSTE